MLEIGRHDHTPDPFARGCHANGSRKGCSLMERLGVGALGLLDRRGEDLQSLPLLTFEGVGNGPVLLLPQRDEFLVLQVVDRERVAR